MALTKQAKIVSLLKKKKDLPRSFENLVSKYDWKIQSQIAGRG